MALLWAVAALGHMEMFEVNTVLKELEPTHLEEILLHHLGKTAEILVFLLGAMTIVEIIDYFDGFSTIKVFIRTRSTSALLWIFSILAFVLSAIIDNLTATIVLISILQKIVKKREERIWFAGLIIVAANLGFFYLPARLTLNFRIIKVKKNKRNKVKYVSKLKLENSELLLHFTSQLFKLQCIDPFPPFM